MPTVACRGSLACTFKPQSPTRRFVSQSATATWSHSPGHAGLLRLLSLDQGARLPARATAPALIARDVRIVPVAREPLHVAVGEASQDEPLGAKGQHVDPVNDPVTWCDTASPPACRRRPGG